METDEDFKRTRLQAVLGLAFGVAVSIGGTIGVGILRTPGIVAGFMGGPLPALLVWVAGAFYVLLGVNYTAELATSIPRSGGPYAFADRIFGRFGGIVVGWSDFLNSVYAVAFLAVALAEYAQDLFRVQLQTSWVSGGIILFFTLLNMIGVKTGSGAQQVTSIVKCLGMLAFVLVCLTFAALGGAAPAAARNAGHATTLVAAMLAFQLILGVYSGWRTPAYFAEEVKAPRDVVRSLFLGAIVVAIVYLGVNIAMLLVLPFDELVKSKLPAADAAGVVVAHLGWKTAGISLVTALAMLSLPSTVQGVLMATSRSLFAMSRDGLFFRAGAKVSKSGSPVVALAISGAAACLLGTTETFEDLFAAFALFGVFNNFLLVAGALLLRYREPELERPYRAFGYPWTLIVILLVDLAVFVGFLFTNIKQSLTLIFVVAALVPAYFWQRFAAGGRDPAKA